MRKTRLIAGFVAVLLCVAPCLFGKPLHWMYEDLAKMVAGAKNNADNWSINYSVSPMDDGETVTCSLDADKAVASGNKTTRPTLILRYKEGEIAAYISYGIFLTTQSPDLTIRFDKEQAQTVTFGISSDHEAAFAEHTPQFLESIAKASTMVVRITPYGESPITCSFNLKGSRYAVSEIIRAAQGKPRQTQAAKASPDTTPKPAVPMGTMNGYDSASKTIIDPINVFKDYENRNLGISGKAKHGEKVTILEKSGNGVKIKTASGVTGWVSNWFVKED